MPGEDGLGPDDDEDLAPAGAVPLEGQPEHPVGCLQLRLRDGAAVDRELLLPQRQVFDRQCTPRAEDGDETV